MTSGQPVHINHETRISLLWFAENIFAFGSFDNAFYVGFWWFVLCAGSPKYVFGLHNGGECNSISTNGWCMWFREPLCFEWHKMQKNTVDPISLDYMLKDIKHLKNQLMLLQVFYIYIFIVYIHFSVLFVWIIFRKFKKYIFVFVFQNYIWECIWESLFIVIK